MRLSRSSHRKRDPAIPNQVGSRRPVPPTCVDPRKLKWSSLRYSPWSALLSSGARAITPNPPHYVHHRLRCPVRVLHHAPPYRPAFHGLGSGSETAPPLRSRSFQRREALRCYAAGAAVAAAVARERERGGGGGLLAAGHARKTTRCGGMRGSSRSRRTPAAQLFYPL